MPCDDGVLFVDPLASMVVAGEMDWMDGACFADGDTEKDIGRTGLPNREENAGVYGGVNENVGGRVCCGVVIDAAASAEYPSRSCCWNPGRAVLM